MRTDGGVPGVSRRVVRLLVLLGAVIAAYLVLSLFDHGARADAGSIDRPTGHIAATDAVKAVATGARKVIPEPTSIVARPTPPTASPHRIHQPAITVAEVHRPEVKAPKKVQAPKKIQAPAQRVGRPVRRASGLLRPTSDAVRDVARASATRGRTAVVRLRSSAPARIPSLPGLTALPRPVAELPALPLPHLPVAELPALPLPHLPVAELPALPPLPSWLPLHDLRPIHLPALPPLPGAPPTRMPVPIRAAALPGVAVPPTPLLPPAAAQLCPLARSPAFAPASGLSGETSPPSVPAAPRTAPLPAPPRAPADRSTPTGQARDSGGGNAPATGTVPSSWRPEVAAAGRRPATALLARGRTVRYAGPPS